MQSFCKLGLLVLVLGLASSAQAYSLFNPVPADKLRELSTDRPDTTESPNTVDAGHYQIELEMLSLGRDDDGTTETDTLTASANLKVGLTDNMDLQLVLEPYTRVQSRDKATGTETTVSGRNDTEVRLKINLWGNDDGDTAAALMPFLSFDTHDDALGPEGKMEGGLIIPIGFTLPGAWESAAMLEFDVVRNAADTGYVLDMMQTITFAHDITENLGGFVEFVTTSPKESGTDGESYFDAGVTWSPVKNMQFDAGTNIGLNDAAEDLRVFLGFSIKR